MKNLLLFIFYGINFSTFAQVHSSMPPEATDFYNSAMRIVKPAFKTLIERDARKLKGINVNSDSLINALRKEPLLKGIDQHSIEAITVLIMVQATKNADADLKDLVLKIRDTNDDASDESNNGTKKILEHKSSMAETIAVVMKKVAASQTNAINNLK